MGRAYRRRRARRARRARKQRPDGDRPPVWAMIVVALLLLFFLVRRLSAAAVLAVSLLTATALGAQAGQQAAVRDSAHILFSVTGLTGPEAVRYDPDQDVYFVASFGESGDDPRDANGFISRVSAADGSVETLRFMTGTPETPLHMPRGMFIRGDTLWVADVDGVHGFLRATGGHAAFIDFTSHEPGFLNDIAAGPDGLLYVTDTGLGRVYRVRADGVAEIAIEDQRTGPPNGITWHPQRAAFLLAPWGGETMLRAWDPATGEIRDVAALPGGRFDGIEVVEGAVVVASQNDSTLHLLGNGGIRPLIRVPGRPADIGVDTRRGRVAVPYIALDRVDVFTLEAEGAEPGSGAASNAMAGHHAVYEAMDRLYERFTRAYRLSEPDSVVALYTDAPLYLPGRGPVLEGKEALRSQFGFLETNRARGAVPRITFESVGRGTSGDLAWDVGYYTLRAETPDGTLTPPSRGKFATIWQRGEDGLWRIHVDSFSPAAPPDR